MFNQLVDIKSLILFIVSFVNLALGALVYFKNRREKINIYYGLTALTTAGWSFGIAIFCLTSDLDTALSWAKSLYVSAALIGASFLSFSFVFPFVKEKPKNLHKLLFLLFTGFIIFISIWPTALIPKVVATEWGKTIELSQPYYLFVTYFTLCMIGAFGNFIRKYKEADSIQKVQIKYVFTGTLAAAIWGTAFDLYLPLFTLSWDERIGWLGPLFTVFMVGLIAYAIFRYHLMSIKVILTDFLVGIMGVILLMLPFLMPNNLLRILASVIFILFCIFGYYLIKATYREAQQKEEAQKLAVQEATQKEEALWMARVLKEFSEVLEKKVKERTKELEEAKNLAEQKTKETEAKREELEKFYKLTVGREIKMGELKGKIRELEEKLKGAE